MLFESRSLEGGIDWALLGEGNSWGPCNQLALRMTNEWLKSRQSRLTPTSLTLTVNECVADLEGNWRCTWAFPEKMHVLIHSHHLNSPEESLYDMPIRPIIVIGQKWWGKLSELNRYWHYHFLGKQRSGPKPWQYFSTNFFASSTVFLGLRKGWGFEDRCWSMYRSKNRGQNIASEVPKARVGLAQTPMHTME